jgi:hypothetical protein
MALASDPFLTKESTFDKRPCPFWIIDAIYFGSGTSSLPLGASSRLNLAPIRSLAIMAMANNISQTKP